MDSLPYPGRFHTGQHTTCSLDLWRSLRGALAMIWLAGGKFVPRESFFPGLVIPELAAIVSLLLAGFCDTLRKPALVVYEEEARDHVFAL